MKAITARVILIRTQRLMLELLDCSIYCDLLGRTVRLLQVPCDRKMDMQLSDFRITHSVFIGCFLMLLMPVSPG